MLECSLSGHPQSQKCIAIKNTLTLIYTVCIIYFLVRLLRTEVCTGVAKSDTSKKMEMLEASGDVPPKGQNWENDVILGHNHKIKG